jgi:hypothetical protein
LNSIPNLHFHRDNHPSVALKSLWPSFLANSSDLHFNIGPLTRIPPPVTIDNHWLRASSTSASLLSRFFIWEVPCCPWRNVHSSHSFSCCCTTRAIVDFETPQLSPPVGGDWCSEVGFNLFKWGNFVSECYISPRNFCESLKSYMKNITAYATADSQRQSLGSCHSSGG